MRRQRTISIVCARCHKPARIAQRQGRDRKYCDDCDPIVKRDQARERMRRKRANEKARSPAPPSDPVTVPSAEYAHFQRWLAGLHDRATLAML